MSEKQAAASTVGLTQDAGWEIGVSRTVDAPVEAVWSYLTSAEGVRRWLGAGPAFPAARGDRYRTADGTSGEFRSVHPGERMRLTWRPADWDHDSTVQVTVSAKDDRTVLRFHQERLAGPDERERQRAHWSTVMDSVADALPSAAPR